MYRQYEDSWELGRELNEAKYALAKAKADEAEFDIIVSLYENVKDLEERMNFAIQDEFES